jgi:hypothetical protein
MPTLAACGPGRKGRSADNRFPRMGWLALLLGVAAWLAIWVAFRVSLAAIRLMLMLLRLEFRR